MGSKMGHFGGPGTHPGTPDLGSRGPGPQIWGPGLKPALSLGAMAWAHGPWPQPWWLAPAMVAGPVTIGNGNRSRDPSRDRSPLPLVTVTVTVTVGNGNRYRW